MEQDEAAPKHEPIFDGKVRPLAKQDLPSIKPILEQCIKYQGVILTDEIEETLEAMKSSLSGKNDKTYFVAQTTEGKVIGVMGLKPLDERLKQFATTDKPIELINAFVDMTERKKGTGRALVTALEVYAKEQGNKEIVLNSGPRYRATGWPAWNKIFGIPVGQAINFYGEGYHAQVWRKIF